MSLGNAKIILGVKTKQEASQIMRELEVLETALYNNNKDDFLHELEEGVSVKLAETIKTALASDVKCNSLEGKKELINDLKQSVKEAVAMELVVGSEPSQKMVDKVSDWVKKNLNPKCVVDIVVDKSIIAGAKITYQGRYFDGTVNKQWNQTWDDIRNEMVISNHKK